MILIFLDTFEFLRNFCLIALLYKKALFSTQKERSYPFLGKLEKSRKVILLS